MEIKKTGYLARTAHDKDHVNRLLVPEYGVIEIRVKKEDNSKKSKSHLLDTATPRRDPKTDGTDDFCFAPGPQLDETSWAPDSAKHDKVRVYYHLYNPFSVIREAKLELFRRWDENAMWSRELKEDELIDGEHELEFESDNGSGNKTKSKDWDGAVTKTTEFPDAFPTVEFSPYKLRLTVKGDGVCTSPVAWTWFHILVHKLELVWGEKEAITNDAEKREPFKMLTASCDKPASGNDTIGRIYLISHIFKAGGSMFDNSLHENYKTKWEDGPEIPVFVKIWVRNAAGNPVVAPRALGTTRFMWDWESKTEAPTNTFVANAQDFDKDVAKPKGLNCHKDRGGKRGNENKNVFPAQSGYEPKDTLDDGSFPFEVKATPDPRKWAAYSKAWTKGKLASKTGVLFRPSRMAGDKYKFTVYAAHEVTDSSRKPRLEIDHDAPLKIEAALKAESGTFRVWRKLYFRRRMTKSGADTVGVGGIAGFFLTSFVDIEDRSPGVEQYPEAEWNNGFRLIYNGWTNTEQHYVDSTVNQYTAGPHGVQFRGYTDFTTAFGTTFFPGNIVGRDNWLNANGYATRADYGQRCQNLAISAIKTLFNSKMPAEDGISLFHTAYSMSEFPRTYLTSFTDGEAYDFPAGSSSKCAFLWLAPPSLYNGRPQGVDATPAHEIGHHLMLPHPKETAENAGTQNCYDAHDMAVNNCLMSYLNGVRELCGFCQLRLRGWDKLQLRTTSALNKRP